MRPAHRISRSILHPPPLSASRSTFICPDERRRHTVATTSETPNPLTVSWPTSAAAPVLHTPTRSDSKGRPPDSTHAMRCIAPLFADSPCRQNPRRVCLSIWD